MLRDLTPEQKVSSNRITAGSWCRLACGTSVVVQKTDSHKFHYCDLVCDQVFSKSCRPGLRPGFEQKKSCRSGLQFFSAQNLLADLQVAVMEFGQHCWLHKKARSQSTVWWPPSRSHSRQVLVPTTSQNQRTRDCGRPTCSLIRHSVALMYTRPTRRLSSQLPGCAAVVTVRASQNFAPLTRQLRICGLSHPQCFIYSKLHRQCRHTLAIAYWKIYQNIQENLRLITWLQLRFDYDTDTT